MFVASQGMCLESQVTNTILVIDEDLEKIWKNGSAVRGLSLVVRRLGEPR